MFMGFSPTNLQLMQYQSQLPPTETGRLEQHAGFRQPWVFPTALNQPT